MWWDRYSKTKGLGDFMRILITAILLIFLVSCEFNNKHPRCIYTKADFQELKYSINNLHARMTPDIAYADAANEYKIIGRIMDKHKKSINACMVAAAMGKSEKFPWTNINTVIILIEVGVDESNAQGGTNTKAEVDLLKSVAVTANTLINEINFISE